jgi:hypothetical protein
MSEIDAGEVAFICTCSASGTRKLESLNNGWIENVEMFLVPQNDPPGQKWLSETFDIYLPYDPRTLKVPFDPTTGKYKDFGEWVQAGLNREELLDLIEAAQPGEAPPQPERKGTQAGKEKKQPPLKSWFKAYRVEDLPAQEPSQLIKGLLYAGQKMSVTGGSKTFKTGMVLQAGFCVANGLPFLERETVKSKVAFIDFELQGWSLRKRLERIRAALQAEGLNGNFDNITIYPLRGKSRLFRPNLEAICAELINQGFALVVIDPLYKLLMKGDENSNSFVADVLEDLTEFCELSKTALIHVHHHSKGNQADKESIDRGSGAGSHGRDADTILDFTDHDQTSKTNPIFSVSVTVRDFKTVDKFVIRWEFPLFVKDTTGLDPDDLKQRPRKSGGRPKDDSAKGKIMAALYGAEKEGGLTRNRLEYATGISRSSLDRHCKELVKKGEILHSTFTHLYTLSLKNAQAWHATK